MSAWTGLGGNGLWSNPNNWSPNGTPASGAALDFPASLAAGITTTNNLAAGTTFASIHIEADNLTVAGNMIVVQNLIVPTGASVHFRTDVQIAAGGTSQNAGTVESTSWMLDVIGSLSNSGTLDCGLTIEDGGDVDNSGTLNDRWNLTLQTGGSLHNDGTLEVQQSSTTPATWKAMPRSLSIPAVSWKTADRCKTKWAAR